MTPIFACSTRRYSGCRQRGFTLLEILLVLTLIVLASAVLLPNLRDLETRDFDIRVREAATLLNHARRTAVVTGMPSSATFYAASADENELPKPGRNSVGNWRSGDIELAYQDNADEDRDRREQIEFSFYPEGGSSGGTLLLSREQRQIAIAVDPFTGRIEVSDEED